MRHPDRDDLVGFMLGALEPEHEAQVGAHAERCRACTSEISHFAPAVGVLAESVEQLEPPPRLRDSLLETVNREAEGADEQVRRERPARPGRSWLGGLLLRPATGLALVALAVAAAAGYLVADGGDSGSATTVAASTPLRGAEGSLVVQGDQATLEVSGMPALEDENAVYQVWVADGETVRPSAAFVPQPDGTATAAVPEATAGASMVMVTREAGPGRTEPTLPTVLEVDVS